MKGQQLQYFFARSNAMRDLNEAIFTGVFTLVLLLVLLLGFLLADATMRLDSKIALSALPVAFAIGTFWALMKARKKIAKVMQDAEAYVPS